MSFTQQHFRILLLRLFTGLQIRRRSALFPAHPRGGDSPAQQPAQGVHVGRSMTAFVLVPHTEYSHPDFKADSLLPTMKKLLGGETQALRVARLQAIKYGRL